MLVETASELGEVVSAKEALVDAVSPESELGESGAVVGSLVGDDVVALLGAVDDRSVGEEPVGDEPVGTDVVCDGLDVGSPVGEVDPVSLVGLDVSVGDVVGLVPVVVAPVVPLAVRPGGTSLAASSEEAGEDAPPDRSPVIGGVWLGLGAVLGRSGTLSIPGSGKFGASGPPTRPTSSTAR